MKKTLRRFLSVILSVILVFSVVVSLSDPIRVLAEENTENQESSPNSTLYVDGIGSGEKNGTSAANAFATLTDAYNAIQENNSLAVIVICGSVNAVDGCSDPGGAGSYYFLPEHSGEVILTSVWGTENFKENAELKFGAKNFYLFGNTILQNIRITEKANNIYANYHSVHLADGIETTDTIAEYLYMEPVEAPLLHELSVHEWWSNISNKRWE